MSLEVGEHIPEKHIPAFVDNLDRHNRVGILLSWAVPGQEGHGHVSCRSNKDVIDMIERRGYWYDEEWIRCFRKSFVRTRHPLCPLRCAKKRGSAKVKDCGGVMTSLGGTIDGVKNWKKCQEWFNTNVMLFRRGHANSSAHGTRLHLATFLPPMRSTVGYWLCPSPQ
eukprot:gene2611-biopygen40125